MKKLALLLAILTVLCVTIFALSSCLGGGCNHNYVEQSSVKSTCSSYGQTTYKCSYCNDTKTENDTSYGEHSYTTTTVKGTCTTSGYTLKSCKNCSYSYKDTSSSSSTLSAHTGTKTCTTCDSSFRTILINWIKQYGTYSSSSDLYIYQNSLTNDGTKHTIALTYLVGSDNCGIIYEMTSSDGSVSTMTILFNDVSSGTYTWGIEAVGSKMQGIATATSIYSSTSSLSSISYNGYSSLKSSYQQLAATFFKTAITMTDLVLQSKDANFSMYNFGFIFISDPA